MLFYLIRNRICSNFLIVYLCILFLCFCCKGKKEYKWIQGFQGFPTLNNHLRSKNNKQLLFLKHKPISRNQNSFVTNYLKGKNKKKENVRKALNNEQRNPQENLPLEEYFYENLPKEPIYPYVSVPDNLYTKTNTPEKQNEDNLLNEPIEDTSADTNVDVNANAEHTHEEGVVDLSKLSEEEIENWKKEKKKELQKLPKPTIEDYIVDINYKKYIHPSLLNKVDKEDQKYVDGNLLQVLDEKQKKQLTRVNTFEEYDEDQDLTEYDAEFEGIGPWPSTDELKDRDNYWLFEKTDLEMEQNLDIMKWGKVYGKETKTDTKTDTRTETGTDTGTDTGTENEKENIGEDSRKKYVATKRKLYYRKEVKTIREAKEEMMKWKERKKMSRSRWTLTKEEINLLPTDLKTAYFEQHKNFIQKQNKIFEHWKQNMVGGQFFFDFSKMKNVKTEENRDESDMYNSIYPKEGTCSDLGMKGNTSDSNSVTRDLSSNSISNSNSSNSNSSSCCTNYSDEKDELEKLKQFQSFRLMEDNVLYCKSFSPMPKILHEWDDPLNCEWRKRSEEVIRDVVMYDYPFKEVRRPSNLDVYDVTWTPNKVEVFVTVEENKNHKITLFELKQLVKKIAERLKELEIDEEIHILESFELVVSTLPNKNILACRKDWNNNIGKQVVVFFKEFTFRQPLEGVLLGSPSVFHLILNVQNIRIENILVTNIDKVVVKEGLKSDADLADQVMLKAVADQEHKVDMQIEKKQEKTEKGEKTETKDQETALYKDIKKIKKTATKEEEEDEDDIQEDVEDVESDDEESKRKYVKALPFDEIHKLKEKDKAFQEKKKTGSVMQNLTNIEQEEEEEETGDNFVESYADTGELIRSDEEDGDEEEEDEEDGMDNEEDYDNDRNEFYEDDLDEE